MKSRVALAILVAVALFVAWDNAEAARADGTYGGSSTVSSTVAPTATIAQVFSGTYGRPGEFYTLPVPTATTPPHPMVSPTTTTVTADAGISVTGLWPSLAIVAGMTNSPTFTVTSTGATGFSLSSYPTAYGHGINWTVNAAEMTVGQKVDVGIRVDSDVPPGIYTGRVRVVAHPNGQVVDLGEIRVQVFYIMPAPTISFLPAPTSTPSPTATVSPPMITSVKRFHEDLSRDVFVIEGQNLVQEQAFLSLMDDSRRLTVVFDPRNARSWTDSRIEVVYNIGIQGRAVLSYRGGQMSNFSDIPTGYTPMPTATATVSSAPTPVSSPTTQPTSTRTPPPTATPGSTATPYVEVVFPTETMLGETVEVPVFVRTSGLSDVNGVSWIMDYPTTVVALVSSVEEEGVMQIYETDREGVFTYAFGVSLQGTGPEFRDGQWVATLRLQLRANPPLETNTIQISVHDIWIAQGGRPFRPPSQQAEIRLKLTGDVDGDDAVTIVDFSLLANSFNRHQGQTGFDARADFNRDDAVTILDFSRLATQFNRRLLAAAG